MRGSVEVHAIGTDVSSPSPLRLRDPPALDMMRYQRISPDWLPLGNGGGGGAVPRKSVSRSSFKDDDAPAVATDGSHLASYLAASVHESKPPRARAPPPPPLSSSAAGRSPARDHAHHHTSDSDTPSPSSTGGSSGGVVVGDVLLQWGHNKRSRCRRDSAAAAPSAQRRHAAAAPSAQRRHAAAGVKIQRRSSATAEKLMPPPPPAASSYTRGSNLRSAASFPSRASASTAGDTRHGGHHPPHHHRSVEERSGGGGQKRSLPDKAHKSAMDAVLHMESKNHHHHDSPLTANGAVAAGEKLERFELPRIYISLSRKEKEEDFLAMKGTKLPQRPKKRAKNVDNSLQFVFPGMWLSDLTKGRYVVREKKCVKKKRRGLKGMESMDSDSE